MYALLRQFSEAIIVRRTSNMSRKYVRRGPIRKLKPCAKPECARFARPGYILCPTCIDELRPEQRSPHRASAPWQKSR